MSIEQITANFTVAGGQSSEAVKTEEDPLGRDAFLKMLVTQLKHQDPLNPLDGTDFSAQLAQFSTLEQMFQVNDNLENIEAALGSDSGQALLDLIGKEITIENSSMILDGGNVTGGTYTLGQPADILINIYDGTGANVAQIQAGQKEAGSHTIRWNGTDHYGDILPDGAYSFGVLALGENNLPVPVETAMTGAVTGVTYEYGPAYLLMGDRLVDPAAIIKVGM